MIEKKIYTCEICDTDYTDRQDAIKCEKHHKLLETATITGCYRAVNSAPYKIMVKFNGDDSWTEYIKIC